MADNVPFAASVATYTAATDKVTWSGDANVDVQLVRMAKVSGAEGSKVVGSLNYHVVSAATTNTANIKASAGEIHSISVYNDEIYAIHVKLHNTAGTPTAGAGVVRTVSCQGGQTRDLVFPGGLAFTTGIGISIVKDITDAGVTAVGLSDCVVDVEYT
jgi:hypothetical protein